MNARRVAARIVLVASGLALTVLCVRGTYVRYKADDFWTASIVVRLGFWKSQMWWYQRWSGRFAYTFLIGVVEAIGPRLVPALVTLVKGDLRGIVRARNLSEAMMRNIKQNLFFAFIYNIAAIPLAGFGWLSPMIASAAMTFSSVTVIANALRLRRVRL